MSRSGQRARIAGLALVAMLGASACHSKPSHLVYRNPIMNYLVHIIAAQPLTIHFSLHNPEQADGATLVPRMLEPLGAFVSVVVRGPGGDEVCRTHPPKFTPKLKPSQESSYVEIEPGYSHGVVLVVEDCELSPGHYEVDVSYSNRDYRGPDGSAIGELTHTETLPLQVN
jgi:hypothetical protein